MLLKTRGIVFKALKYSETSFICEVYTEERGLQSYIFSGVRTAKPSTRAALLQVMTLLDLVAYGRDGQALHRVREVHPAVVYQSIPFSASKRAIGLFCIEVAQKTIRETEANPALFEFLFSFFHYLDISEKPLPNLPLFFLLHLAAYLGFAPLGEPTDDAPYFDLVEGTFVEYRRSDLLTLDAEGSSALFNLLNANTAVAAALPLKKNIRNALLEHLLLYYYQHVDGMREIASHHILRTILA